MHIKKQENDREKPEENNQDKNTDTFHDLPCKPPKTPDYPWKTPEKQCPDTPRCLTDTLPKTETKSSENLRHGRINKRGSKTRETATNDFFEYGKGSLWGQVFVERTGHAGFPCRISIVVGRRFAREGCAIRVWQRRYKSVTECGRMVRVAAVFSEEFRDTGG